MVIVEKISFSIHPSIKNKPQHWESRFAFNWQKQTGTLDDLREQVMNGCAFVAAAMKGDHRNSAAFEGSSLAVVDVDDGLTVEGFLQNPLAKKAAWLYTTTSHDPSTNKERFRVIFQLPEFIEDPDLYKEIVTLLVAQTGADKQCTDCCRTFYGNDKAEEPLFNRDAILDFSFIEDAKKALVVRRNTYDRRKEDIDDHSIALAIHCLENVIDATSDGQRRIFTDVTTAAKAGGDELFPYWQEWATRCHHGLKKNQTTRKFFDGFNGQHLGAIFTAASKSDPDWRKNLPPELKNNSNTLTGIYGKAFAGYEHSAFHDNEDDDDIPIADNLTQGLFSDRTWTQPAVIERAIIETEALGGDTDDSFVSTVEDPDSYDPPNTRGGGRRGENQVDRIRDIINQNFNGLRLNVMNQQLEFGPKGRTQPIHDPTLMYLNVSQTEGTVFPKTLVFDIATQIGYENRYHPVKKYLTACASSTDPCPYFDRLATELLGVSEDPIQNPVMPNNMRLADLILKRFMVGAVSRVMSEGCRHDWMPILIGSQNCGKSTFFQYLTPPNPLDGTYPWVTTMQQSIEYLSSRPHALHAGFIVVMDEFERYTKRKFSEELKNLISVSVDRSARKYENEKSYPRAFVLAGATNNSDFLSDPTGNRRFLPIQVLGKVSSKENPNIKIIDLDRLKRDRDSIWHAAYKTYLDNPVNNFSSHELSHISEYTDSFTKDSPIELAVSTVLKRETSGWHNGIPYVTLNDMFRFLDIPVVQHNQMTKEVTDCMKRMGCNPKRIKENGEGKRVWIKN